MRLGDIVEALISVVTLGYGKRISMSVARLFGFKTCGCDRRRIWLNNLFLSEDKKEYPIR
jgi:hypothetical protein